MKNNWMVYFCLTYGLLSSLTLANHINNLQKRVTALEFKLSVQRAMFLDPKRPP